MKLVLGWIAGGMLVAGVVLGVLPIDSGEYRCGSAFHAGGDVRTKELTSAIGNIDYGPQDCAGARSQARQIPVALVIVGSAIGAAAVASSRERRSTPAGRGSAPQSA